MDGYWTRVLIFINLIASSKDCSGLKTLNIGPFPTATVTEEGSVTFTCIYSNIFAKCLNQALFSWFLNNNQTLLLAWRDNGCVFGEGNSALIYTCSIHQYVCEITLTLTLTQVQRQQHGDVWGCRIENMQKDSTIVVNVPITSVDVTSPTTSPVTVSENSPSTFVCETSAGRPQATIKWYKQLEDNPVQLIQVDTSTNTQTDTYVITKRTLQFTPTRSDHGYRVYCTAYNIDVSSTYTSNNKPQLYVQYPPTVLHLTNDTAVENATFSKYCMVTPGNPDTTVVKWIKVNGNTMFKGHTLTIGKVTRGDAGTYRCTARNKMQPTGESAEDGTDSATFLLDVYYSASIIEVTINDANGDGPFIYDENTTVTIACVVDCNPGSEISISRDGSEMSKVTNMRDTTHTIEKASCSDAGMYSCTAKNQYNGNSYSTISQQVYFRCPPRLVDSVNNYTYFYALYETVTLNLTVTAYPEPTFRWYKQDTEITNGVSQITMDVSKNRHQTNLTLELITQDDLGQYKVVVTNNQGTLEYLFFVAVQGMSPAENRDSESSASVIAGAVGGSAVAVIVTVIVLLGIRRCNCSKGLAWCIQSKSETTHDQRDEINNQHVYVNTTASPDTTGSKENIDRNMYEDLNMSHLQPQLYEQLQQGEQDKTCDQKTDKGDSYETLDHGTEKPQLYDSLQHTLDCQTETSKVYENLRLS